MNNFCYVIMEEVSPQTGKEEPIFATLDEVAAIEKQQEIVERRTRIMQVPLLRDKSVIYHDSDDFEPLGCHGCGDW
jgi:hypothetical protein